MIETNKPTCVVLTVNHNRETLNLQTSDGEVKILLSRRTCNKTQAVIYAPKCVRITRVATGGSDETHD